MSHRRAASAKGKKPPPGFDVLEPVLDALENELRDRVKESNAGKRNVESMWPVHQINWQRSRYVYDMYYTYKRVSRRVYEHCVKNKLVDASLIAKWKKPGYERLCSTYVINPANYKFGTTSICRVPMCDRSEEQRTAQDPTTGCLGCASGRDAGPRNIFGNKYGQNLAAVQIARERRVEAVREKRRREAAAEAEAEAEARERRDREEGEGRRRREAAAAAGSGAAAGGDSETDDDDDEASTDDSGTDSDDDDYGPAPAAGIWAGSRKLEAESQAIADDAEEGDGDGDGDEGRPSKKARAS